ncbi:MAG: hypothetical protein AAFO62_04990 [Pseudomonadota bacterium]
MAHEISGALGNAVPGPLVEIGVRDQAADEGCLTLRGREVARGCGTTR